jgi:negative regulator of flagellin synthesis FlgM
MKIESTVKTSAPTQVVEERTRAQRQAEKPAAKSRDEVQVSSLSSKMHEIESEMKTSKTVDSEKVAKIRKAIEEGRFEVNSSAVADKLIEHTREFIRTQKQ